ncbi:hypothetical protein AADG60_03180 [Lactobacillus johnsonii]|uniref:hypothetical protein n=1 Tax=Lactobacillus johnsonii TaxID=33959 RepID=UPI0031F2839E
MSKKVTSIDFVFENCEVRTLPINAIPSFYFYDLIKNISHQWILKSEPVDEIETTISCRYAHFQIDYELAKKLKLTLWNCLMTMSKKIILLSVYYVGMA